VTKPASKKWRISIRFKILALITGVLVGTLVSYLYLGTSLIVQDKTSYIYDYNLSQVRAAAVQVENRVRQVVGAASILASIEPAQANSVFAKYAQPLGIKTLVFLRASTPGAFMPEVKLGSAPDSVVTVMNQQGWTPEKYSQEEVLIGTNAGELLPVGGKALDFRKSPVAFVAMLELDNKLLESGKDTELQLLGPDGHVLARRTAAEGTPEARLDDRLRESILRSTFDSGVRDLSSAGTDFIVGYQRLEFKQLTVVSFIQKDLAFTAANALVKRSIFLGVSILFLAIGFALIFVKGLTQRLRDMWTATQRVSHGDFSFRVELSQSANDEVADLAASFNAMAGKIDELMLQTAEKAKIEKELETAQVVQSRFFPHEDFEHANLKVAGAFIPASQCGGDWWHYMQHEDKVVSVVGDATGHGVSAALVTAAVHGVFSVVNRYLEAGLDSDALLRLLVTRLNRAVSAAAGGDVTMTFLASVVDLKTGVMNLVNCSHTTPYLYRKKATKPGAESSISDLFVPLLGDLVPALGREPELDFTPSVFQLLPGDMVFFYTDGLMDCRNAENKRMSKVRFLKSLAQFTDRSSGSAKTICDEVMKDFISFLGTAGNDRADDVTVLVSTVPGDAKFQTGSQAAA
jgi:phosphoserine phosphatase RsbU/P